VRVVHQGKQGCASKLTPIVTSEPDPFDPANEPRNAQSLGALIVDITQDLSKLVRKEIELAKGEIAEVVRSRLVGAGLAILGAVLGLLLIPFILLTVIEVLDIWMPRWVAALIVTGLMAAAGGGVFLLAMRKLKNKVKPERTIRSLKEDAQWIKHRKNSNEK